MSSWCGRWRPVTSEWGTVSSERRTRIKWRLATVAGCLLAGDTWPEIKVRRKRERKNKGTLWCLLWFVACDFCVSSLVSSRLLSSPCPLLFPCSKCNRCKCYPPSLLDLNSCHLSWREMSWVESHLFLFLFANTCTIGRLRHTIDTPSIVYWRTELE